MAADDEAGDVLHENQRDAAEIAELDEVCRLERRFREQHAVVGDDADEEAMQAGKARDERVAVARLELVEARAVEDARDDLVDVVRLPDVGVDDAVHLGRVVLGLLDGGDIPGQMLRHMKCRHNRSTLSQRVRIIFRKVVGDA